MAKVIIGIHGLGNKPPREILESWWRSAMVEGLEKNGATNSMPKFEMAYWADLVYEKPLDEKIEDFKHPYFIKEKYTPGMPDFKPEDNPFRQKFLDFIEGQLDKLFLNTDLTVNYKAISDMVIRRYFRDLETYYSEESHGENELKYLAKNLIRERLVNTLKKYNGHEIMLIGHSMGSIIAYDVLTFMMPQIDIHTFVTIGSPLGFPVVQGRIAAEWLSRRLVPPKLKTPPGVKKHWYNLADLKDKIALIYDMSENFQPNYRGVIAEDFVVYNDYQSNKVYNPHKSFGYLRTREFAQILADFSKKKNWVGRFLQRYFRI